MPFHGMALGSRRHRKKRRGIRLSRLLGVCRPAREKGKEKNPATLPSPLGNRPGKGKEKKFGSLRKKKRDQVSMLTL